MDLRLILILGLALVQVVFAGHEKETVDETMLKRDLDHDKVFDTTEVERWGRRRRRRGGLASSLGNAIGGAISGAVNPPPEDDAETEDVASIFDTEDETKRRRGRGRGRGRGRKSTVRKVANFAGKVTGSLTRLALRGDEDEKMQQALLFDAEDETKRRRGRGRGRGRKSTVRKVAKFAGKVTGTLTRLAIGDEDEKKQQALLFDIAQRIEDQLQDKQQMMQDEDAFRL